jgi:hypothetical protein
MLTKRFALAIILALSLMPVLACSCAVPTGLGPTNELIKHTVQTELIKLDFELSNAADELSQTGLSGTEARNVLNRVAASNPFVIDICTTDLDGKMVTVAPDAYSSYEGTDISTEEVTVKFNETRQPMLSQMFPSVEGIDAVVLIWPILSQDGEFLGSVNALFEPETLFTPPEEQFAVYYKHWKDTPYSIDVFQLDGLDIYDSTGNDTGTNLFTELVAQQYPDLIALGHQMVAEETGTGSYTNIDPATGKTVKKEAYWSTVTLHDTAWRIMSAQVVEQP